MTGRSRGVVRRSLQRRLAALYATGMFVAGAVVLAIVGSFLVGVKSTVAVGRHKASDAQIASSQRGVDPHQLIIGSVIALAVLVPVSLVVGWLVAGRFLEPLRAVTATAREISAGDLHRRLDLGEAHNELTDLGRTVDELLARLEGSFQSQRHFVANASHELRTPIAGLRTLIEVALAGPDATVESLRAICEKAVTLSEQQDRLIAALLALATSERGVTEWKPVDLAEVSGRVAASRHNEAKRRDINVLIRLAPATTTGDPRLVEALVTNLVDNAIRHNVDGGHVEIATTAAAGEARVSVRNTGPIIPADQIERIFEPFQRLSDTRGHHVEGYGLGLAIVQAVATSHGATRAARPLPEGGLAVEVSFPQLSGPCGIRSGREAPPGLAHRPSLRHEGANRGNPAGGTSR